MIYISNYIKVGNLFFSTYYVLGMMLYTKDTVENKTDTCMILTLIEFIAMGYIMNNFWFYIDI